MVEAFWEHAKDMNMNYGEACAAIERLHVVCLYGRYQSNGSAVAAYLDAYGPNVAQLIRNEIVTVDGFQTYRETVH